MLDKRELTSSCCWTQLKKASFGAFWVLLLRLNWMELVRLLSGMHWLVSFLEGAWSMSFPCRNIGDISPSPHPPQSPPLSRAFLKHAAVLSWITSWGKIIPTLLLFLEKISSTDNLGMMKVWYCASMFSVRVGWKSHLETEACRWQQDGSSGSCRTWKLLQLCVCLLMSASNWALQSWHSHYLSCDISSAECVPWCSSLNLLNLCNSSRSVWIPDCLTVL